MQLNVNNIRYDTKSSEIRCAKHMVDEAQLKKTKEEDKERIRIANEEVERRENEGGWRGCIGALATNYAGLPVCLI
jgi:hypothetical protein